MCKCHCSDSTLLLCLYSITVFDQNLLIVLHHMCPSQTPAEGASTAIYAAAASEMEGVGGCYLYNGQKTQSSDVSYNSELQAKLWKKSCELVDLQDAKTLGCGLTRA